MKSFLRTIRIKGSDLNESEAIHNFVRKKMNVNVIVIFARIHVCLKKVLKTCRQLINVNSFTTEPGFSKDG